MYPESTLQSKIFMSQTPLSQKVTIDLPTAIFQKLLGLAEATQQPIEAIVAQSVVSNLPPTVEKFSPEMQPELLKMQTLSIEDLLAIAESRVDEAMHGQHVALLEKHQMGDLTADEQVHLMRFQELSDRLMLRKAYAWAMLRWRGYPIPAVKDLAAVG
jgi:hypothetical protein